MGSHDEQPSQVLIAHFRDAARLLLAAGRGLSRCQAKKGSERARAREKGEVLNARYYCRGCHRAQRPAVSWSRAIAAMARSLHAIS